MTVAEANSLTVRFGSNCVIRNMGLAIPSGRVGLLGPNGAGKSTLLKTLLGHVKPSAGTARVLGLDVATSAMEVRRKTGYMPEHDCTAPEMTAVEFVSFASELSGAKPRQALEATHEAIDLCGIGEERYRLIGSYSTGMRQRVKLAQAIVHKPQLLLLDEPTNGLDPLSRDDMLGLIVQLSQRGDTSIVLCSHLLRDVERTCEHVVVLHHGTVRAQKSVQELKMVKGRPFLVELNGDPEPFKHAIGKAGWEVIEKSPHQLFVNTALPDEYTVQACFFVAEKTGLQLIRVARFERTLEEALSECFSD